MRSIKRRHFSIFGAEHTEINAHISKETMIAHKMMPLECVRTFSMQRDRSFEMIDKCCLAAIAAQIEQHFTLSKNGDMISAGEKKKKRLRSLSVPLSCVSAVFISTANALFDHFGADRFTHGNAAVSGLCTFARFMEIKISIRC
jgi:hypothetical protein